MDFDLCKRAIESVEDQLLPDELDALESLLAMFEPYEGDDPEEARARQHAEAHCPNCGWQAALMFFPAPAEQTCTATLRLAQCPRCFCTSMRLGKAPAAPG